MEYITVFFVSMWNLIATILASHFICFSCRMVFQTRRKHRKIRI